MFKVLSGAPFKIYLGRVVCGNRDSEIGHGEIGEDLVVECGCKGGICKSRNGGTTTVAMRGTLSVMALGSAARLRIGMRDVG